MTEDTQLVSPSVWGAVIVYGIAGYVFSVTVEYADGITASSADCVIQTLETQKQSKRTPCLLHVDMNC